MKNKGLIIGGLVAATGAVAYFVFRKKEAIDSLNVNVVKVDYNKQSKTFVVFVRIINPANANVSVKSIVGDVIWNDNYGATIDFRQPFVLKPLEDKTIQLPVKMNLDLINVVKDILTKPISKMVEGTFKIDAKINAEGLVVPFKYIKDIKLTK